MAESVSDKRNVVLCVDNSAQADWAFECEYCMHKQPFVRVTILIHFSNYVLALTQFRSILNRYIFFHANSSFVAQYVGNACLQKPLDAAMKTGKCIISMIHVLNVIFVLPYYRGYVTGVCIKLLYHLVMYHSD